MDTSKLPERVETLKATINSALMEFNKDTGLEIDGIQAVGVRMKAIDPKESRVIHYDVALAIDL